MGQAIAQKLAALADHIAQVTEDESESIRPVCA
jgi:hypothetical protein